MDETTKSSEDNAVMEQAQLNTELSPSYPPAVPIQEEQKNEEWWLALSKEMVDRVRTISNDLKNRLVEWPSDKKTKRTRRESMPEIWLLGCKYIRFVSEEDDAIQLSALEQLARERSISPSALMASLRGNASTAIAYSKSELFMSDFRSRLWMTYRTEFPTLVPSSWTTDVGWGCMLRSGQMLLGQCLIMHQLGREWRFGERGEDNATWESYVSIIKCFIDTPNKESLFSIHQITKLGLEWDVPVGEWYGPSTIAQSLKKLVSAGTIDKLNAYVASDATIYKSELADLFQNDSSVFLMIPIRLGVDQLNPIYFQTIIELFKLKHSLGVAGGRPNSAVYFVGTEQSDLIYLDPHFPRDALKMKDYYTIEELMTYHCDTVRKINVSSLDPSLLLGFYCKSMDDFEILAKSCQQLFNRSKAPLFSVLEKPPNFDVIDDWQEIGDDLAT